MSCPTKKPDLDHLPVVGPTDDGGLRMSPCVILLVRLLPIEQPSDTNGTARRLRQAGNGTRERSPPFLVDEDGLDAIPAKVRVFLLAAGSAETPIDRCSRIGREEVQVPWRSPTQLPPGARCLTSPLRSDHQAGCLRGESAR